MCDVTHRSDKGCDEDKEHIIEEQQAQQDHTDLKRG